MNQARKNVAAVAVGTEPVTCARRKRGRTVFAQVRLQGVMRNRGHNRPHFGAAACTGKALGGIFLAFAHIGKNLRVIGFRLVFPAKIRIAVPHERREIRLALGTQHERFIIDSPWTRERK